MEVFEASGSGGLPSLKQIIGKARFGIFLAFVMSSKIAELKWLQLGIRVCKARNCEGIVRNKIDERMTGANETREQQEKT